MSTRRISGLLPLLLSSLLVFVFSTATPVLAASGTSAHFTFHGLTAFAEFDTNSPDGCVETFVYVDGTQGHKSTEADVFVGQFDNCTQTLLLSAFGSASNPHFQVDKKLGSASLSATIPVTDEVSGTTLNVSVSVTWTALDALMQENGTFHFHSKGFIDNSHFNAAFRDANASGTVSNGTTNYTPASADYAQIASMKTGDVSITHP
jgi:hypothetical protein